MKISIEKFILALGIVLLLLIVTAFAYSSKRHISISPEVASFNKPFNFYSGDEDLFQNQPVSEFIYDIDSRYLMNKTKSQINEMKSMADFVSLREEASIISFQSIKISILDDNYNDVTFETGNTAVFNPAQLALLQEAPYSSNILIDARFQEKNKKTGRIAYKHSTPHITIIPEQEAQYENGKAALITYLKENSKEKIGHITKDRLKGGKVSFTITDQGKISGIKLLSTSGYRTIDVLMLDLISKAPGKWLPGSNASGENIAQELIFSFGTMGC